LPAAPGPRVHPETRFEAACIKAFDASGAPRMSTSPGRYDVAGGGLPGIGSQGLRVPPNRIIGLPDWSFKELYTITAKAPEGTPSTDPRAMFVMVGNLLKDRFKMATHTEMREMPVFHIVFARSDKRFGPALKESSAERQSARVTPGMLSFSGAPMAVLAGILTPSVGRPVLDKTGLTSR